MRKLGERGRVGAPGIMPLALGLSLLLAMSWPARAQRDLKTIPNPDPELERRSFIVADGFEVNLFAADPLLAKPIQMNFDSAGRLWVACSEVYPQIKPGQKANDKVIILEDTDGDGRADKTTVFADGLLIPTGVEPGDGGAYVAHGTELLHLKDTDGDGRADQARIVLSGFGTEDTHHILHTLRWGPDGMLYFNQSVYIHSHIETPYGVRRLNGGGIWQFRPEAMRLEVTARGFWNPWGHHFDRWGQEFATDGANGEGINYLVPGASYAAAVGASRVLQGLNPGSPKHCGLEVLSGRHLPGAWRGNVLTNDFRGHRVCRFVLSDDGSGFASREMPELIKTDHPAFRPIDVKMGPDGAIYIADWYNPIIQHGEVDFRDPRRDHTRGRIWRVTARGRPLVRLPRLAGASTAELLEALKSPEDWTRHQAKRVLKERGAAVEPALASWVRGLDPADPAHEHHLLEALWTYQSLDVVQPELLARLLRSREPRARAAAVRVVPHWKDRLSDPVGLLAPCATDAHPRVRLEAVRALAQLSGRRAAEVAFRALDRASDRFLDYALWLTARELEPDWLPAFTRHQFDYGGNVDRLVFALQGSAEAVRPLAELLRAGKVPVDRLESVLNVIAGLGGPAELGTALDVVLSGQGRGEAPRLLKALDAATRRRTVVPSGDLGRLGKFLDSPDEDVRSAAARLAGRWHAKALGDRLCAIARADGTPASTRLAVLEAVVALGGSDGRPLLEELAGPERPVSTRRVAVLAMASAEPDAAARHAAALLGERPSAEDCTELFQAFLSRKGGADRLARALAGRRVSADVAKLGVRAARTSGRGTSPLVEALTRAGGLTAKTSASVQEVQALAAEVLRRGDAARGEAVFRRPDLACLKCHAVGGAGGQAGPDLGSIGASAPVDYLVESILLPNKAVKENYHALVVTTKDGRYVTGVKVRETKTELVLRDAEDRELAVPLADIEDQTVGGSLMPEGLADNLTRAELIDLVRFLSELGKVGRYGAADQGLVRRWRVLEPTEPARRLLGLTRVGSAAGADPTLTWTPAYSRVSGHLPPDAIPRLEVDHRQYGFARFELDVPRSGRVRLRWNDVNGLHLWVDGSPSPATEVMQLHLSAGSHTLTVAVEGAARPDGLRVRVDEGARPVGGK